MRKEGEMKKTVTDSSDSEAEILGGEEPHGLGYPDAFLHYVLLY